jgi:glycosyltransferase involved in cell wall biosynthesis
LLNYYPTTSFGRENSMDHQLEISIVIPVFNSAKIFPELYSRLKNILDHVTESFEIIAVLDGCSDKSLDVILNLRCKDNRIKILEFSRNFGHQAALTAGLEFASGEIVAVMDDDLEDPPEVLPQFFTKIKEGFDVVYGIRKKRQRSFLYCLAYTLFYRFLGAMVNTRIPYDAGDFCVMTKRVVNVLKAMPENNRFIRGMRAWAGFKQVGIKYDRGKRHTGNSGYNIKKYFSLALDAIFSFSYKPLKFLTAVGIGIASISFFSMICLIILKLLDEIRDIPGWASLFVAILFFSGIQILSFGILGEYIARVYDEVKQRPKYIIKNAVGFKKENVHGRVVQEF